MVLMTPYRCMIITVHTTKIMIMVVMMIFVILWNVYLELFRMQVRKHSEYKVWNYLEEYKQEKEKTEKRK